jgi:hypothetical protein
VQVSGSAYAAKAYSDKRSGAWQDGGAGRRVFESPPARYVGIFPVEAVRDWSCGRAGGPPARGPRRTHSPAVARGGGRGGVWIPLQSIDASIQRQPGSAKSRSTPATGPGTRRQGTGRRPTRSTPGRPLSSRGGGSAAGSQSR